jgi:hypothetical protein
MAACGAKWSVMMPEKMQSTGSVCQQAPPVRLWNGRAWHHRGTVRKRANQRMTPVAIVDDGLEVTISHLFVPYCQQPRALGAADAEMD